MALLQIHASLGLGLLEYRMRGLPVRCDDYPAHRHGLLGTRRSLLAMLPQETASQRARPVALLSLHSSLARECAQRASTTIHLPSALQRNLLPHRGLRLLPVRLRVHVDLHGSVHQSIPPVMSVPSAISASLLGHDLLAGEHRLDVATCF